MFPAAICDYGLDWAIKQGLQFSILISEDVMHQINHSLPANTKFIGNIDLKGWHQPLSIYKIA